MTVQARETESRIAWGLKKLLMDFLTHEIRTKSDVAGGRASHQPHHVGQICRPRSRSYRASCSLVAPASPLRGCCRRVPGRFEADCLLPVPWNFCTNACPGVSASSVCFQNIPARVLRLRSYHRLWTQLTPPRGLDDPPRFYCSPDMVLSRWA